MHAEPVQQAAQGQPGLFDQGPQFALKRLELNLDGAVFHGQPALLHREHDLPPVGFRGGLATQATQHEGIPVEMFEPRGHVAVVHQKRAVRLGHLGRLDDFHRRQGLFAAEHREGMQQIVFPGGNSHVYRVPLC